jgi:hypothetical protein
MGEKQATPFAYIAFDDTSKKILAHGARAVDALCGSDLIAPAAAIYILDAGPQGWKIWAKRMDLMTAKKAL